MSSCNDCKNFLNANSITDRLSYLKWSVRNHPDKFRQFGEDDDRYKEANRKSSMVNNCYPRWYVPKSNGKTECSDFIPVPSPPRAPTPPRAPRAPRSKPARRAGRPKSKKPCKKGYSRNKSTGRCRKTKSRRKSRKSKVQKARANARKEREERTRRKYAKYF